MVNETDCREVTVCRNGLHTTVGPEDKIW